MRTKLARTLTVPMLALSLLGGSVVHVSAQTGQPVSQTTTTSQSGNSVTTTTTTTYSDGTVVTRVETVTISRPQQEAGTAV